MVPMNFINVLHRPVASSLQSSRNPFGRCSDGMGDVEVLKILNGEFGICKHGDEPHKHLEMTVLSIIGDGGDVIRNLRLNCVTTLLALLWGPFEILNIHRL